MGAIKDFLKNLNLFADCRKYNISSWQCPQFLFFVMGILIIGSAVSVYFIGNRYIEDPLVVSLVILFSVAILMTVAVIITNSFEQLAKANRMKSEFVNIVSHQLRSPLINLRWTIELLMSGKLGKIEEKQTSYFHILKENNSRMLNLVSDLLTVSKIENAKLTSKKEKISLKKIIDELMAEYMPLAKASNVELQFEAKDNIPEVLQDPLQITLVMENFLDNAIRYTKEKGKIEIKLTKKNKDIYFAIKDSGVGIPKDDQKYIFHKFFRSENIMRHQTMGSGLGLYIAKSIINKMGGKIGFTSKEGKGSTFWFTLPIKTLGS